MLLNLGRLITMNNCETLFKLKVGKIATPKIDDDGRDSMSVCTSLGTHGNVSRQSTRCN